MATITKVRRVANPRRRRRVNRALRNKRGQFLKRSRATRTRANRPKRKHNARRVVRRRNPVLIEIASALAGNPRKRRKSKSMATKRKYTRRRTRRAKAVNPRRRRRRVNTVRRVVRRRRRQTNPMSVAPVRRRRRYTRRRRVVAVNPRRRIRRRRSVNVRRRRRMNGRSRRNPMFGQSGISTYAKMIGGGLVGVAVAKYIPTLIPASVTASLGTSPIMSIVIAGAGAFAAGYLAKRFLGETVGDAVLFGGLMQTGSLAMAAFAPAPLNTALALSGLGDIMPGYFTVPQNSVTNRAPVAMMPSAKGVSGFAPGGFGFRRR